MKTDDFDYYLPQELIAQTPLKDRSASRLLVLDKETGKIEHKIFKDIVDMFDENDVLVFNNSRVIPARLFGVKEDTHAHIELLLLKNEGDIWETLTKPARRISVGSVVSFGDGILKALCVEVLDDGIRRFKMIYEGIFLEILDKLGEMPLPPYIHEHLEDKERYQTVYSRLPGSAAAPTAGLHFTNEILDALRKKGVKEYFITLHVGLGTFRPVSVSDVTNHKMHSEFYQIDEETADGLNEAIRSGKRIVSVGTTTTRTLESAYDNGFKATSGWTDIFIYPGYKFKCIGAQITNFHLPKSTLIMLVSAFAGKENIMKAYNEAVKEKYRFFSFGDSMLIK
ncbi:MAG: tRNA preQ1(34) S-adenosylmethionine ribosyltransferase-isomerase QueA [Anaeroplasmataceae bacterium]